MKIIFLDVDWLHGRGLEFYLESNSGLYASEQFEEAAREAVQEYSRRKGKPGVLTVRQAFPDMIFGGELVRDDLNKVSYLLSSYRDFLDTRAQFPDLEHHTWGGAGEAALFGDLGVKNIDKAAADYVTGDVDRDGLYQAFEKLGLLSRD